MYSGLAMDKVLCMSCILCNHTQLSQLDKLRINLHFIGVELFALVCQAHVTENKPNKIIVSPL